MPDNIQQKEHLAIENIFGKPPGWILHWGITIGLVFLLVCLGVAYFVKYPDKLTMQGELIVGEKPIEIVPKINGFIDNIFVEDKTYVNDKQLLVILKSTLQEKDLDEFNKFADKFVHVTHLLDYLKISPDQHLKLGALTPLYSSLIHNFLEFRNFLQDTSVFVKIKSLKDEILQIRKLNASLNKQGVYYAQEVALTEKDFNRNLSLEKNGAIAPVDKEKAESKLLNEKRHLEAFKTSVISNDIRIQQLKTQITVLTTERKNGCNTRIFKINQQLQELNSQIKEWEDQHKIIAPISGQISFHKNISQNEYIKASEPIFTIVSNSKDLKSTIIEGFLPIRASGTLKVGQHSIIEFENYPGNQYGTIKGKVSDISLLPNGGNYRVIIELPNDLKTSYNRVIKASPLLKANVTISTQEYSLLERIFQNILDIAKNQS